VHDASNRRIARDVYGPRAQEIDRGRRDSGAEDVAGPYLEGKGSWALQLHHLTGPEDAVKTVNFRLVRAISFIRR